MPPPVPSGASFVREGSRRLSLADSEIEDTPHAGGGAGTEPSDGEDGSRQASKKRCGCLPPKKRKKGAMSEEAVGMEDTAAEQAKVSYEDGGGWGGRAEGAHRVFLDFSKDRRR